MTMDQFDALAATWGWKHIGSNAYGVHRNYPFSVYLGTGRLTTLTVTFRLRKGLKARAVRALRKELPKGCSLAQPQAGAVHLVCAGTDGALEESLRRAMDAATATFQEEGLLPPDVCPYCKHKDCDALAAQGGARAKPAGNTGNVVVGAALGGMVGALVAQSLSAPATGYVPVHRACVQERAAAGAAHAQKNLVAGSYGKGLLGAVLGALVAAIPSIAFQVATYSYFYLLAILVPLGAWFGYKKLGGRQTMAAFWIVAAVTLVTTWFVVDQVVFYFMFCEGNWVNPFFTMGFFYEYYYLEDIIADLIYPTLWTVVGLVAVFGQCKKERASVSIEDAGVAVESLLSYTPRGGVGL